MKPDSPLEAFTHYLWPVFVVVLGVLGWFIRRSIVSFEETLEATNDLARVGLETGQKLVVKFDAHEKADDSQFRALWENIGDIENRERERLQHVADLIEAQRRTA